MKLPVVCIGLHRFASVLPNAKESIARSDCCDHLDVCQVFQKNLAAAILHNDKLTFLAELAITYRFLAKLQQSSAMGFIGDELRDFSTFSSFVLSSSRAWSWDLVLTRPIFKNQVPTLQVGRPGPFGVHSVSCPLAVGR